MVKTLVAVVSFLVAVFWSIPNLAQDHHDEGEEGGHHHSEEMIELKHEKNNERLFPPSTPNHDLATRPAAPELVSPEYRARVEGSAQLAWKSVAGAENYHVQVATDPNFKWLQVDETVKTTNYTVSGLKSDKSYFWRVAAVKPDNNPMYIKSDFAVSAFLSK